MTPPTQQCLRLVWVILLLLLPPPSVWGTALALQDDADARMPQSLRSRVFDDTNSRTAVDEPFQDALFVHAGLTFSRTFQHMQDGSSFSLQFDSTHCTSKDAFGDNDCHYKWGETVNGEYSFELPEAVDVGDTMQGEFKLDRVVPYEFTCLLCGEPCILEVPVIETNYTIDTPPCPVGPSLSHFVKAPLKPQSPTDGIRTHIAGTVKVQKANGDLMAEFSVEAYVK